MKLFPNYLKKLVAFLTRPDRFVAELDLASWKAILHAGEYLALGGTLSILVAKTNIHFYDERIRRVIEIQDKVANHAFLFAAVAAFGLLSFLSYRIVGGRASLRATLLVMMYAVSFTAPVLAILLVVVTRAASAILNVPIVVIPPAKIVEFDTPVTSGISSLIGLAYRTIFWAWNLYVSWILWTALRVVNQIGYVRGTIALIAAVALLYSLGGPLGRMIDVVIAPLRPFLEWLF